jgi:ribose transport system substrate-binding protein
MKTKVVAVFMGALLTVGLFAACSQDSKDTAAVGNNDAKTAEVEQTEEDAEQEGKSYTFGATYMTLNNPFFVALNNGIKDVVEANDDVLIALDPALDPNKQVSQIEDLIAQGVDAIFVNPADWKGIRPALEAAEKAGVPIINVDAPVYDTELVSSIIASDNYNAGVICAQDMMSKLDSAKIVVLEHPTAKSAIDRTQGFIDTIAGMDQYEIVAQQSSEGQLEQAMPVMENIIQANPEIDVVMALNDPTAMGALAALLSAKREEGVLIYGVDGAPEAKQMIRDGKMTATAAQSPITIGKTAAEVAYTLLEGGDVEKEIFVDVIFIDENNVDEYGTTAWQ